MPESWSQGDKDKEEAWEKAKKIAKKAGRGSDWAYIMAIAKKIYNAKQKDKKNNPTKESGLIEITLDDLL